jgi:osmoprotectant transport system ATP-binding protein
MIQLEHLAKRYGATLAVDDLSLEVKEAELLVLLGASGCGKTTTLKMINRLVEPSAGRVRIGGRDVAEIPPATLRRRIGYCFQQIGLFPHMTVAENIAVTPQLLGWEEVRVGQRVEELLALVELEPALFHERYPHELSGGQQQRVGIARALAAEPEVLLMDEPFGSLDPPTRDRLQQRFQSIRAQLRITTIFVTHDMVEALILGDRIAVLESGRLLQIGSPRELLRAPADSTVASLMETPRRQAERVDALLCDEETGRDDGGFA